jgi:hypothetical protein
MQEKMVLGQRLFKSIPLHNYELNYEKCIYELEDHVGEKTLSLNLLPKLGLVKNIYSCKFSQSPAKKRLNQIYVSLSCCPPPPPRGEK